MIGVIISEILSLIDITTVLLFSVIAYLSWKYIKGRDLPPGPWGIPVLGYLPFLGKDPAEETLTKLSKKYGNVMSLYFGSQLVIVLNSYDAIKEAFLKHADNFAGRPQGPSSLVLKIREEEAGVGVTDGEPWREHRRFILSTFRDYGMGKLNLEPRVSEEVHCFLDVLAEQKGQPYDLHNMLGVSTANIICTLEFGKRFDYNDSKFVQLRKLQDDMLSIFPAIPARAFLPWVKYMPFSEVITHQNALNTMQDKLDDFIMDLTQEHMREYTENSRKDLIDAYFSERNELMRKKGDEGYFNEEELKGTLNGLFGAGTETTTTTLRWGFLIMLLHPEIKEKVQKEIDQVIGMERSPSITDKAKMPYTEAVLMEMQRFGSIVPLNLPHSNIEATELFGYKIPKRSFVISNLWAVHFDPNLWNEPEKFKPERFLNKEGKVQKSEYLISFGIGKRACLGESLARMELFLYFVGTLQRFDLQPPPGTTPKLEIESLFVRRPKPYKLCTIERKGYSA